MLIVQLVKLPENPPRDWAEGSPEALIRGLLSEVEEATEGINSEEASFTGSVAFVLLGQFITLVAVCCCS